MSAVVSTCGDINGLPEDCIANVLSLTSPKDACRLSLVATTFRSAAASDAVWERFLPSDYRDIISRSNDSSLHEIQSKKDLYLRLSDHPILIDSGRKSFMLEKSTGKKCCMIAARDLCIIWGDMSQYWKWKSHPESRFLEVAELVNVCWLEIRGGVNSNMLSFDTNYAAHLVFTTDSGLNGFDQLPVKASVGIRGDETVTNTVFFHPLAAQRRDRRIEKLRHRRRSLLHSRSQERQQDVGETEDNNNEFSKKREDGWMEVKLGECRVTGGDDYMEMTLLETEKLNWKSGVVIQGIEIRPMECT